MILVYEIFWSLDSRPSTGTSTYTHAHVWACCEQVLSQQVSCLLSSTEPNTVVRLQCRQRSKSLGLARRRKVRGHTAVIMYLQVHTTRDDVIIIMLHNRRHPYHFLTHF